MSYNNNVLCAQCLKSVAISDSFSKSVINLKYHPDELREKRFCSTQCVKAYVEENTPKVTEVKQARIYNWSGGCSGY